MCFPKSRAGERSGPVADVTVWPTPPSGSDVFRWVGTIRYGAARQDPYACRPRPDEPRPLLVQHQSSGFPSLLETEGSPQGDGSQAGEAPTDLPREYRPSEWRPSTRWD